MEYSSHSTSTTSNPPQQHSPSRNPPPISSDSTSTQIIDVDKIASSIREKLFQTSHLPPTSQCSIFKVPDMLRRHNEKAFMPEVVSIGPFHPKNEQLQAMENIKVLYLKCLLCRTGTTELENLVKALGRIEQDCRKCYAGEVGDLSVENFTEMMVIDGCFILEFLSRYLENRMVLNVNGEKDPVFKTSWMPRKIIADLLLLENQLPWYVLDCLFNLVPSLKTTHQRCSRLDDLVCFSFSEYKIFPAAHSARSHEKHAHLLDCFRNCLVGSCTLKRRNYSEALEWKPVKPVTELILHGIIPLKAKSRDNILDVKFKNGLMEIPEIVIEENTESVFRNLIAFEHCDQRKGNEITSYAALLDCLIKSPADALNLEQGDILRIIGLSNEDRASFLNRLLYNNDTSFHGFLYSDLCQDVNKICSSWWGVYTARLRRHYFSEPWALVTFLLGVLASLGLSIAQTYFAILSHNDLNSKSAK